MTKRLTIALVAIALFVIVAVLPSSCSFNYYIPQNSIYKFDTLNNILIPPKDITSINSS